MKFLIRIAAGLPLGKLAFWRRENFTARAVVGGILSGILILVLLRQVALPSYVEERLGKDYSRVFLDREGDPIHVSLSRSDELRFRNRLEDFSPELRHFFLANEDRAFYFHPGVNPVSVLRAAWKNLRAGKITSGASTITLQLAKLQRPPGERTMKRKIFETLLALRLELRYSKNEILAHYLNSVPMGGNVTGLGAGAWYYFGKKPSELSLAETAVLAAVPNAPPRFRPDRNAGSNRLRKNRLLTRTFPPKKFARKFAGVSYDKVLAYAYAGTPQKLSGQNIYLAGRLAERLPYSMSRLSIDRDLQRLAAELLATRRREWAEKNVRNAGFLVVENATRKVRAYIGNFGPEDNPFGGWVNALVEERAPGSTLKPFIYALALDRGLTTPRQTVYDIPRDYDLYAPLNFSRRFNGPVPAAWALVQSLNLPVVEMNRMLSNRGLESFLTGTILAQDRSLRRSRLLADSGFSIALGGFPVTPEELATLYLCLALRGEYGPLQFLEESQTSASRRVLSPAAAYLVSDMLSENERPDLPRAWEFAPELSRVAFKTGTSFGLRDAWTVAYDPEHTVVIWIGNVSGEYSHALVGREAAAPVALEFFRRMKRHKDLWFERPASVSRRPVCSLSGEVPGLFCAETVQADFIPGVSGSEPCRLHREIFVSGNGSVCYCRSCLPPGETQALRKIVAVYPVEVEWYLRRSRRDHARLPPHHSGCPGRSEENRPKILSPKSGGTYEKLSWEKLRQGIPLQVYTASDVRKVFWYEDRRLIAECTPDEVIRYEPTSGVKKISAVDDSGRSDSVELSISFP